MGLLNLRPLRFMGLISYSVYLLHGAFLYVAQPSLAVTEPTDTAARFWCIVGLCAIATLLASTVTYCYVETPCINLDKHWRRRRATARIVRHQADVADAVPADVLVAE